MFTRPTPHKLRSSNRIRLETPEFLYLFTGNYVGLIIFHHLYNVRDQDTKERIKLSHISLTEFQGLLDAGILALNYEHQCCVNL